MNAPELILDTVTWQTLLDGQRQSFAGLRPGAALGIVPRAGFDAASGEMLVWRVGGEGVRALTAPFRGFREAGVDILFVASADALQELHGSAEAGLIATFRRNLRQGQILFYLIKGTPQLMELGYEDLLESLGLAFMGTCLG